MNLAIVLGLASALSYGVCDFVARLANRKGGVLRTMVWGQGFLALLFTCGMVLQHSLPAVHVADWMWLVASNFCVLGGTACLYRGLAVGRISVVAPLMACYGAISALLAITTGEKLVAMSFIGLAAAATGAVLSASSMDKTAANQPSGWRLAVGAALLYGVGFWMQGKFVVPKLGPIFGLWIYYVTASVVTGMISLVRRSDIALRSVKEGGLIFGTALLAGGGYVALAVGQTTGAVAIVTALSAASTAVTVLLAFCFLKDKPSLKGWLGVALVIAGVSLLDLSH